MISLIASFDKSAGKENSGSSNSVIKAQQKIRATIIFSFQSKKIVAVYLVSVHGD